MSNLVFGKSIVRRFYPYDQNGNPCQIPTQDPAIYVFSSQPSRGAAAAGTDAVATVITWTQSAVTPWVCEYTIAAIDDPNPTTTLPGVDYWIAINYKAELTEQTQTRIEYVWIERQRASATIPETTKEDLKAIYPALSDYISDPELDKFLVFATDQLKLTLKGRKLIWDQITDLRDLRLPLTYLTIALCAFSQVKEEGDRHDRRYNVFYKLYSDTMDAISIPYDADRDGVPDYRTDAQSNAHVIIR